LFSEVVMQITQQYLVFYGASVTVGTRETFVLIHKKITITILLLFYYY